MTEVSQREQRRAPRLHLGKEGTIKFSARHAPCPCVVRDISEAGARLKVQSVNRVPDTFQLSIEPEDFSAECIVVWRAETEVGVIFESAPVF